MNQQMEFEKASHLSRQVTALYGSQSRTQDLGAWVMTSFFPEINVETLANGRDFYCAQRPHDARLYLMGMLRSGRLNAAPLEHAVALAPALPGTWKELAC